MMNGRKPNSVSSKLSKLIMPLFSLPLKNFDTPEDAL
jgi:hypothetical protein